VRWNPGQKPGMSASRNPADETRDIELPPSETGPVPVSMAHAQTRWFGMPPPLFLFGLAAVSFVAGVALLATGHWPYALIMLGLAAMLGAAFLEVARRRPDSPLTRASAQAAAGARERARATIESLRARSSAVAEQQRIRSARAVIDAERRATLLTLGEAVHREDEAAADAARARLAELGRTELELARRLQACLAETDERVRRARLTVQQTMIVRPEGEATPPTPPRMPEPYPPPDEGTPPTPAPVPEPSPEPQPKPDEDERRPAA
jgi:ABC-type multidrug transport system fused ATPase/permease subunit